MASGTYRLNYENSANFVRLWIACKGGDRWKDVLEFFQARRSENFYLDPKYIDDTIDTDDRVIADLFYYYDELSDKNRLFLKMKWKHYSEDN